MSEGETQFSEEDIGQIQDSEAINEVTHSQSDLYNSENAEKQKSPEELEAERMAMTKLLDIEGIFQQEYVFDFSKMNLDADSIPKKYSKSSYGVRNDLEKASNYFHSTGGNNIKILEEGLNQGDASCYSFWQGPPIKRVERGATIFNDPDSEIDDIANKTMTSIVLSKKVTAQLKELRSFDPTFAEVSFATEKERSIKPSDFSALIIAPQALGEFYDTKTDAPLTEKKRFEYLRNLDPFYTKLVQAEILNKTVGGSAVAKMVEEARKEYESQRDKLFKFREAIQQVYLDIASVLGNYGRLPVFDGKGNLLWPKQMSKEEVIEYIQQRKAEVGKEE